MSSSKPDYERIELRPDRDLVDPNFDSYKLSLDSLPQFQTALPFPSLTTLSAGDDQYSFLHSKLFGQTNLLVSDPFDTDRIYLLDPSDVKIYRVVFDKEGICSAPEILLAWSLPSGLRQTRPGDYNASLVFPDQATAVLADGKGTIFILDTGDRSKEGAEWKSSFHEEICGKERPFKVSSAVVVSNTGEAERMLHCLLTYVEEKGGVEGLKPESLPEKVNFVNVVEWMTFASAGKTWGLDRVRRFAYQGATDYLQLNSSATGLVCSADKPFQLVFDSTGAIELAEEEPAASSRDPPPKLPAFYWFQSVEDIVVWVVLPDKCGKKDLKVVHKPREMSVHIKGEKAMGGELWNVLDADSMTWTIQDGKIEINVCKANEGLVWQKFVSAGGEDGMEINNPDGIDALIEQLTATQTKEANEEPLPAYNAQELEACDALPDDSFALFAIDGEKNKVTHKVNLSGHQLLFDVQHSSGNEPLSLCLRHDVDGFVWQPKMKTEAVSFEHVGSFAALGYVQASKAQRKYTVSSPDLSYAAIVELSRRVYLYRQPSAIASEFDLRNRKSGERVKQVAKQQVVTLESTDVIHGVAAANKTLVVATTSAIICFRIN